MRAGDWINLFTSIGTVLAAALAFAALWYQVRNLSEQVTLQNFSEYTKRYAEIVLKFPEKIHESDFVLKDRSDYDGVMRNMRVYFDLCFEEWLLNDLGMLDRRIWRFWSDGMKVAFRKPAFKQSWSIIKEKSDYGGRFEAFVDAAMAAG